MPLKTIVKSVTEPQEFDKAVTDYMEYIQNQFLAFNRKHTGKRAEISRSVTFYVTPNHLVCILYFTWGLAEEASSLLIPQARPGSDRIQ